MDPGYSTMPEKSRFGAGHSTASSHHKGMGLNGVHLNSPLSSEKHSLMSTMKIDDYASIPPSQIKTTVTLIKNKTSERDASPRRQGGSKISLS